jgi:signal transduction histidine kinase
MSYIWSIECHPQASCWKLNNFAGMNKCYLSLIFFIALSFSLSGQTSISPTLNQRLADSLKPKNITTVTIAEALKVVQYASPDNADLMEEYRKLSKYIESEAPKLISEKKAEVYYALMLFSYNVNKRQKLWEYSNLVLKYIDRKNTKNYRNIGNCYTCRALVFSDDKKYSESIDNCYRALEYAGKLKNSDPLAIIYQILVNIHQVTYQYDKALYYNNISRNRDKKESPNYFKLFRFRYPLTEISVNLQIYLKDKKESALQRAETVLDSMGKSMMKDMTGRPLYNWHLYNAYVHYFKKDYAAAEAAFLESGKIDFYLKDWSIKESKTFQVLLYLKTNREKEAVDIFEKEQLQDGWIYATLLNKEIYNYFKSVKNFERANHYLEKLMSSEAFESQYKLQGEIILANNRYNVREKQFQIEQLGQKANIEKSQNQLKLAVLFILLLISFIFIVFIKRQSKIKRMAQEQLHKSKIALMEESLAEVDNKLFLERKSIGENIHNDLLGDLVALRYLTDDFSDKATDPSDKGAFTAISKELDSIYKQSRNYSHTLTTGEKQAEANTIFDYLKGIKERFSEANLLDVNYRIDEDDKSRLIAEAAFETQKVIHSIIKESIANTIKHSDAKEIAITINFPSPGLLRIAIKDNGKILSKREQKGIGLESLRTQIMAVGGSIAFTPMEDGFQTVSTIPFSAAA